MQLLLFGLGMEFSFDKVRDVGAVAILGGALEIALLVATGALGALAISASISEGVFVGALLSMSSTSVVIKSLGDRSADRASQIVIGTLILQDCSVGLMFAMMPVLASLNDPAGGVDPETYGEIVLLIVQVRACARWCVVRPRRCLRACAAVQALRSLLCGLPRAHRASVGCQLALRSVSWLHEL